MSLVRTNGLGTKTMMFDDVKGYATRERAAKTLAKAIENWPEERKYVEHYSMIVALPSGRYVAAVRFRSGQVNMLMGVNGICLFN